MIKKCLKCNEDFDSVDPARNRICPSCNSKNKKEKHSVIKHTWVRSKKLGDN